MSEAAPAAITIENVRRDDGPGSVIATFDVRLGGVLLRGLRLLRSRAGGIWLGMPRRRRDSDEQWFDLVELTPSLRERERVRKAEAIVEAGGP